MSARLQIGSFGFLFPQVARTCSKRAANSQLARSIRHVGRYIRRLVQRRLTALQAHSSTGTSSVPESYEKNKIRFNRSLLSLSPWLVENQVQPTHDLSGYSAPVFMFRTRSGFEQLPIRYHAAGTGKGDLPWPHGTRGVLYYHQDPTLPPISGALRFRICNSVEEFDQGEDHHISPGRPWSIPLVQIARTHSFRALRIFLVEQNLVDLTLMRDISRLPVPKQIKARRMLYALHQPLVFDLDDASTSIHLVTRKGFNTVILSNLFLEQLAKARPYSGKCHLHLLVLPP